ncbi:putative ferric reductase transmembrane component [Ancistrocladus abbreviatus]
MSAPNMATLTASLERSLQNCSLNHSSGTRGRRGGAAGLRRSSSSDAPENHPSLISNTNSSCSDTTLVELNSHISLPYNWEQCLDLKTGEIYYINWRNGMKAKEDPRINAADNYSGDYRYSVSEEEEEEEEEDDDSYDSEGSSTESSSSPGGSSERVREEQSQKDVLVLGGCKSCLMYFMVPKHVEDCPKCTGQLLHFDRSDNDNGSL